MISLLESNYKLAQEWHPNKNEGRGPGEIGYQSSKKVWWKCENGHEWQAQVNTRSNGSRCPYCSNKKLLVGYNDLATLYPELLSNWHPIKNGNLKPQDVLGAAHTMVWWYMPYDDPRTGKHFDFEWKSTVQSRIKSKRNPYLANRRLWRGFNDLATVNPEIAKEWHPSKNGALTARDVIAGSRKSAWWRCKNGHEWKTSIRNRAKGARCQKCFFLTLKGKPQL